MRNPDKIVLPAPYLRWAGGKRVLAPVISSAIDSSFDHSKNKFFEPFVGGGAVFFSLASRLNGSQIVINDVNPDLVASYRVIQGDLENLIKRLNILSKDSSATAFAKIRAEKPKTDLERAARFIFLNKTCFNGLWRVNSSGQFNVPYGQIKNPLILDEALLRANSEYLTKATIRLGSYITAVADAKSGDYVYLDPPYIPLNPTSSFSKYAKDDFTEIDQYALAGAIKGLTKRGVKVIFSNSDTPLTREIYGGLLELRSISVTRSISAQATSRNKVDEVLGVNFDITGTNLGKLPLLVKRKK